MNDKHEHSHGTPETQLVRELQANEIAVIAGGQVPMSAQPGMPVPASQMIEKLILIV